MTAATPAEWASAGFGGLSAISLIALGLAFADADLAYFDPRPLMARVGDRLLERRGFPAGEAHESDESGVERSG